MEVTKEYTIKHQEFEGPLELLLSLIQKRKFFINEISLASVTQDYLQYLQTIKQNSLTDTTSFISVAGTLILIKSKSLLPNLDISDEEEGDVKKLEHRLLLYKVIQDVSYKIKLLYGKKITATRNQTHSQLNPVFSPDQNITLQIMRSSIEDVIVAIPTLPEKKPVVVVEKMMSIEQMITSLTERIQKTLSFNFKELSSNKTGEDTRRERVHVIVSFLAILELVRQGILGAVQCGGHNDIYITKEELQVEQV